MIDRKKAFYSFDRMNVICEHENFHLQNSSEFSAKFLYIFMVFYNHQRETPKTEVQYPKKFKSED